MWGVALYVDPSMLFLLVLVTVLYGGVVRGDLGLSQAAGYLVGLGFVVCLLGSVLLHELGHAVAARWYGIGVRGITLELLGGYTELDRDAPTPRAEAVISLIGPAVSLVLGAAATGLTLLLPDRSLGDRIAFELAASNIIIAVFNVLPGLPLDGGRALRAGVWAVTNDRHRATELAGWAGQALAGGTAIVALVLAVIGLVPAFPTLLVLFVAVTLAHGAGQSVRSGRMSRRYRLIDLSRLARPLLTVPSGTPLAEAQRRGLTGGRRDPALAVVDSAGRLMALVDGPAAAAIPAQRRPWVTVDTVSRNIDEVPELPVGLTGEQVVRAVRANPGAQYLVTAGKDVLGVLHVVDLAQLLEPRRSTRRPSPFAARR